MPILLGMLALSMGVTATLLGMLSVGNEMGARRRDAEVRRQRLLVAVLAYVLLALAIAAKATGRLPG